MVTKKTIQVILFEKNLDLFRLRLEEHDMIDLFVVAESLYDKNSKKKTTFFNETEEYKSLEDKIIYFNFSTPENTEFWEIDFYNELLHILKKICKNFEDLIFISRENEFVDYSKIFEIRKSLETNPILLKHVPLWWGKNYREPESVFGTVSLLFSHIFSSKKILDSLLREKDKKPSFTFTSFYECGWSLNGFFIEDLGCERFSNELLPYKKYDVRLSKYKCEVPPKIFDKLKDFYVTNLKKNIQIIIIEDVETFRYSVRILPSNSQDDSNFIFYKPNRVLYGDLNYNEFIEIYKFNECYRIIKKYSFDKADSIQIISDGKNYIFESSILDSKTIFEIINPS